MSQSEVERITNTIESLRMEIADLREEVAVLRMQAACGVVPYVPRPSQPNQPVAETREKGGGL